MDAGSNPAAGTNTFKTTKMNTIKLQINPAKARQLHKTAPAELKTILEESAPKGFFSTDPTERIKCYEDACAEIGIEPMDDAEKRAK